MGWVFLGVVTVYHSKGVHVYTCRDAAGVLCGYGVSPAVVTVWPILAGLVCVAVACWLLRVLDAAGHVLGGARDGLAEAAPGFRVEAPR